MTDSAERPERGVFNSGESVKAHEISDKLKPLSFVEENTLDSKFADLRSGNRSKYHRNLIILRYLINLYKGQRKNVSRYEKKLAVCMDGNRRDHTELPYNRELDIKEFDVVKYIGKDLTKQGR